MTRILTFLFAFLFICSTGVDGQNINYTRVISLNSDNWQLATDSLNEGRERLWFRTPPVEDARTTRVPWVIQDEFHNYHGVAWYWRRFTAPVNTFTDGRYILRFKAVDYKADVWLNGNFAGSHEGSETPFDLDVTGSIVPGGENLLVVRVLNPAYQPMDGLVLKDTPSGAKQYPFTGNAGYNSGGIVGDAELLVIPAGRIGDVLISPDWKTGKVKISAIISGAGKSNHIKDLTWRVSGARSGLPLVSGSGKFSLAPGDNLSQLEFTVPGFILWSPEDPVLYRFDLSIGDNTSADQYSARFGFRDFRFENGYFRLNGKRVFLRGNNFSTHFPAGFTVPPDDDMLRRDVINMKSLGFNFVRIPFGCPVSRVLDIYDELGILVQQEHFGCWQMGDYGGFSYSHPANNDELLRSRFEKSITEVIRRDRNHACLVMWGVLNENSDGPVFRKAVEMLPELRRLDPARLFVLNSGRFDGVKEIGSMSNPGSDTWDVAMDELRDWHPYVMIPYSSETLDILSGKTNKSGQKSYISETGLCFPIDLPSELGDYQLAGKENSEDAVYFKRQYDKFLNDWKKFGLDECWASPHDYISDAYRTAVSIREIAESAIRSNPFVVSYTPTNGVADAVAGESMATNFRRIKPELIAPVIESNEKLRWCLRTEPQSIYSGDSIWFSISISDLDVLPSGVYHVSVKVLDPSNHPVAERKTDFVVTESGSGIATFAREICNEKIRVSGPEGKYLLLVALDKGATVPCGEISFYVSNPSMMPRLPAEVTLCGNDPVVCSWLIQHGVKVASLNGHKAAKRELIVIAGSKPDSCDMPEIASRMARGSTVVFLSATTLGDETNKTKWLPLAGKGVVEPMDAVAGYYRADRWVKHHPLFDGMPAGGMMDYKYYRNLISIDALSQEHTVVSKLIYTYDEVSAPLDYPAETICGATRISHNYCSGIHLGIWNFYSGRFIVNTLNIAENLGHDPAADRLFGNILSYGASGAGKPLLPIPADFEKELKKIGYK
jgi:hypothetical protein